MSALNVLCAQLTRDLFAIAKFLCNVVVSCGCEFATRHLFSYNSCFIAILCSYFVKCVLRYILKFISAFTVAVA